MAQYEDLAQKIDEFAHGTMARRAGSFACRAGCEACCHVSLSVSRTEARRVVAALDALPGARRDVIAARAAKTSERCVMLDDEGRCEIYAARPLVCRTQGLPLGYPGGVVPATTVRFRTRTLEVVCCPLNFTEDEPEERDVLDAARVDTMLALVARLEGDDGADGRVTLRALASGTRPAE